MHKNICFVNNDVKYNDYRSFRVATHRNNKKVRDFSQTVKQCLLTMQDDYSSHEPAKIRITQRYLWTIEFDNGKL